MSWFKFQMILIVLMLSAFLEVECGSRAQARSPNKALPRRAGNRCCGGCYNLDAVENHHQILSPDYPEPHPDYSNCEWEFSTNDEPSYVPPKITVDCCPIHLNKTGSYLCQYARLDVYLTYLGSTGYSYQTRLCEQSRYRRTFHGTDLKLRFYSNLKNNTFTGFRCDVHYGFGPVNSKCDPSPFTPPPSTDATLPAAGGK